MLPQQVLYVLLSSVPLAMGINKFYHLGIYPTEADWASYLPVKHVISLQQQNNTYFDDFKSLKNFRVGHGPFNFQTFGRIHRSFESFPNQQRGE